MRKIYNKRNEYKAQHNPLELIYKIIMNALYGKSIQKPYEKIRKYFHTGKDLDKYHIKNYYKIIEVFDLEGCGIKGVETRKQIDDHFNNSLFGIHVLAMAKRIMNEVMCLAFDIGCRIYYQDTDSMHIEEEV